MSELLELALRCEKATGPDDALDRDIWLTAIADDNQRELVRVGRSLHGSPEADFRIDRMMEGQRFTASLDAAMTLVPEGWEWELENAGSETYGPFVAKFGQLPDVEAKTLPLAICAASLKARASGEGE